MCGRTACTLPPAAVSAACSRLPYRRVQTAGDQDRYRQSHNTTPHQTTPVLIQRGDDLVVHYMRWGLVPSWYKGTADSFKMHMINARKEGLADISSFRNALERGQRCVVIAEGFYEWQVQDDGKTRQPYYVFIPPGKEQDAALEADLKEGDQEARKPLMAFAGIYDVHQPKAEKEEKPLHTYTIITVPSAEHLHFLHDRMPAVLPTREAMLAWLDTKGTPLRKALELLQPYTGVDYYPVSPKVGSIQNSGPECRARIKLPDKKKSPLMNWLKTGKSPSSSPKKQATSEKKHAIHADVDAEPPCKLPKQEAETSTADTGLVVALDDDEGEVYPDASAGTTDDITQLKEQEAAYQQGLKEENSVSQEEAAPIVIDDDE
eukprot:m.76897 g.76897  ORF g.76897 m.76897 type:complete len:376 (-) comp14046_c2_seq1:105-1232(-)